MLMQLDLSDDQKAQVREILPAYRAAREQRQADIEAMRLKMRDLMEADGFDENAVRQAFREMTPLMEDMAVLRVQFMHDVKAVLTPAQIAQIKTRHEQRAGRRGEHRRVREAMLDTWLDTPAASESAR
jgi:Spy/CpxP family protein refolding chaperone